jgi:hypothetical protein
MADEIKKTCLFYSEYEDANSPPTRLAKVVLAELVAPAVNRLEDFQVDIFPFEHETGSITDAQLEEVEKAELVIADVTDLSAGAYYALGMRHAFGLPTVYIIDKDHTIQLEPQNFLTLRYRVPHSNNEEDETERTIDHLEDLIRRALAEPSKFARQGTPTIELSPFEQRARLAERIEESVEAVKLLRINSLSETVEELTGIATELRIAPDEKTPSALRESAHKALMVLHSILDELATKPGGRLIISGAIAAIIGGIGTPQSVAGFGLALSVWYGKAAFGKALDKFTGKKPSKKK